MTHPRPGAPQDLDLTLDRLIKRGDQSNSDFIAALPGDLRRVHGARLDLQSDPAGYDKARAQAEPSAVLVQIANNPIHDFVPGTVRDLAAQNAPFPLSGTTLSVGLRGSRSCPHGLNLPRRAFETMSADRLLVVTCRSGL